MNGDHLLRLSLSEQERSAKAWSQESLDAAKTAFRRDGALIIENVIDLGLVSVAREEFVKAYDRYLDGKEHSDALDVGKRRLMITVDIEPPFDNTAFFANAWLMPIFEVILDKGFVIDAFGVICSLPNAPAQNRHSDGGILYAPSGLDPVLPASAITAAMPLIEMNELYGTTTLWLGSHRDQNRVGPENAVTPSVSEGSCILWDFRLKHAGTANQSKEPRPLLYLTYCRPWWIDHLNFSKKQQMPLRADKKTLTRLSESHRGLLARVQAY